MAGGSCSGAPVLGRILPRRVAPSTSPVTKLVTSMSVSPAPVSPAAMLSRATLGLLAAENRGGHYRAEACVSTGYVPRNLARRRRIARSDDRAGHGHHRAGWIP